jgi:hypothetical protein
MTSGEIRKELRKELRKYRRRTQQVTEIVKDTTQQFKDISPAEYAAAIAPVKVRVKAPWRVVHEGKPYGDGDLVTVPGHVAAHWERSSWVERVKAPVKAAPVKAASKEKI